MAGSLSPGRRWAGRGGPAVGVARCGAACLPRSPRRMKIRSPSRGKSVWPRAAAAAPAGREPGATA